MSRRAFSVHVEKDGTVVVTTPLGQAARVDEVRSGRSSIATYHLDDRQALALADDLASASTRSRDIKRTTRTIIELGQARDSMPEKSKGAVEPWTATESSDPYGVVIGEARNPRVLALAMDEPLYVTPKEVIGVSVGPQRYLECRVFQWHEYVLSTALKLQAFGRAMALQGSRGGK